MLDLQDAIDLIDSGRAEEALPQLTAWAKQLPMHAAVHAVLARAYEATKQWDDARAAWKDVHFLMPNSPAVAEGLARVREATAQPVAAGEDRLVMDLDLQAELEATLEALFNPFTLPQQNDTDVAEDTALPEEDIALTEDDVTLAQVQAALAAAAAADENDVELLDEQDPATDLDESEAAPIEPEDAEEIEAEAAEEDETEEIEAEAPEAVEVEDDLIEAEETEQAEAEAPADTAVLDEGEAAAEGLSIYDEVDQLIEEKEAREHVEPEHTVDAPEAGTLDIDEDTPPQDEDADVAEELEQHDLETDEPDTLAAEAPDDDDAPLDPGEDLEALLAEEKKAIEALEAMVQEAVDQDDAQTTEDSILDLDSWQDFETEDTNAPTPSTADFDDLERLISELETARIVPQPELEDMPAPDLDDDIEDMVSETLARIYASQKQYHEAARVYEQLALHHPEDADRLNKLADEMNTLAGGAAE